MRDGIIVFVGVVVLCLIPPAVMYGMNHMRTPLQRQQLFESAYESYSVEMASDGCYWRTYYRHGDKPVVLREVRTDGQENCPLRK